MQYFFLEKQSPLTQRWKVRQIAFDPKYRYLYYSGPVSQSELEAAAHAAAIAELSGREEENVPLVTWRKKIKVTALDYMADEYAVPPTSADFQEKMLLTMRVTGYERKLERVQKPPKKRRSGLLGFGGGGDGSTGASGDYRGIASEDPLESTGRASQSNRYTGFGSNTVSARGGGAAAGTPQPVSKYLNNKASPCGSKQASYVGSPRSTNTSFLHARSSSNAPGGGDADDDPPPPEPPSPVLHLEGYDVGAVAQQDEVEDAEENLFRDIELVPDSNPDDLDADEDEEDEEDEEEEEVLKSPTTRALSEAASDERTSYYSFSSTRTGPKTITITFRARNYDAFRVVSLRLRQALVRHGLYQPLHAGLPPYDPRNGIAFATVPLHLRYQFRRLNDVVFYSFQHGHAVYVRHQREVRGLSGYLCITHDSVLLLQADGKCPRWVDLEDITGIDYVLRGSRSFVCIIAAAPMPDFLFIPIFPTYPLVSNFDAESAVEGVVGMLRRLLMQRLRADEDVSLAPLPKHEDLDADNASDVDDYDALCHIRDLTEKYEDCFQYISLNGPGRPLEWKWENSKTPKHFTYKKDLAEVLKRDESEDDDEESDDEDVEAPHREGVLPAHRSDGTRRNTGGRSFNNSLSSAASFTAATVAQLLAPPSEAAELRARERLRVTRTDPEKREMKRAQSPGARPAPVTVAAVAAVAAGGTAAFPPGTLPPAPSAKPESYGLVHAPQPSGGAAVAGLDTPHLVPAAKGARLPVNVPAVVRVPQLPHYSSGDHSSGDLFGPAVPAGTSVSASPKPPAAVKGSKSTFGVTNTKNAAPAKPPRGKFAHVDPATSSSLQKVGAELSEEEDEEEEDDDDVFDSEDVDDLLDEPSAGAFQTPPRRKRNSKLLRKHRGQPRHSHHHEGQISDEDSDYDVVPHHAFQSASSGAAAMAGGKVSGGIDGIALPASTEAGLANPVPGVSPHLHPGAAPVPPPSMPTPTLQANTKLATDFLVTATAPTDSPQSLEPLPPPALQPPSTS